MNTEKLIDDAYEVIKSLKTNKDVILSHHISNLVNMNTCEETGIDVCLELNKKYDYTENILIDWKQRLNASTFYIGIRNRELQLHYRIHK